MINLYHLKIILKTLMSHCINMIKRTFQFRHKKEFWWGLCAIRGMNWSSSFAQETAREPKVFLESPLLTCFYHFLTSRHKIIVKGQSGLLRPQKSSLIINCPLSLLSHKLIGLKLKGKVSHFKPNQNTKRQE